VKLGCASWSYHAAFRAGRLDQREWLRRCADEMELDGVELADLHFPTTEPSYLRDVKKLCADLQLTVAGVAVTNDFGPEERRQQEIERVRQWCDIAAVLGAPIVRVFAGWTPVPVEADEGRIVGLFRKVFGAAHEQSPRRTWSDVTWALRACADYAAERGIVLALQNSARDGLVGTTRELEQCVADVGSPWLKICLDPADLPDTAGIDGPLAQTVQAHARLRVVLDDGSDRMTNWPDLLRRLRLARYRGFVLLDYEGGEDPETAVPRAARYMRGLLLTLGRRELLPAAELDGVVEPSTNGHGDPAVAQAAEGQAPTT